MNTTSRAKVVLAACWVAIFWPGAFVFGIPGVLSAYWQKTLSVGQMETGRVLFFILAATGFLMFITGKIQDRLGFRVVLIIGTLITAAAQYLLIDTERIQTVYLWAFITGGASCMVYLPVITTVQLWYPHKRGLASGFVNLSFGIAAAVTAPLFSYIFQQFGLFRLIVMMSSTSLSTGLLASLFIQRPKRTILPADSPPGQSVNQSDMTPIQCLKTRNFWLVWAVYACAGAAGIAMVSQAVGFGLSKGLPLNQAILILSAFSLTNGISRIISGYLSDHLGRKQTLIATFLLSGLGYFGLDQINGLALWMCGAAIIGFTFGTLFAVTAPLLGEIFGMAHFGTIFGMIFTAYGFLAGILGPWVSGYLLDTAPHNYGLVFAYLGTMSLAAAVMIGFVKQQP